MTNATAVVSPLRRRMIDDMSLRNLSPATSDPICMRSRSSAAISDDRRIALVSRTPAPFRSIWSRSAFLGDL